MSFFKRIFGKGKSKEEIAEEFILSQKFEKAVDLTKLETPVSTDVLLKVVDEMIREDKLDGRMVGKKGWYLPRAKDVISDLLESIDSEPLQVKRVMEVTGLNRSRSVIAIKDHIKRTPKLTGLIFDDKEQILSPKYMKNKWKAVLNRYDFGEEEIQFEDVVSELPNKDLYLPIIEEYLKDPKSPIVRDKRGIVLLREMVDELISEKVKTMWEAGAEEISFEEIADEFGVTLEEASNTILRLVNNNELPDVTVYTADELIKRRSSH